jgi:DNA-binding transcriptional LysR family regulator
MDLDGIDIFVAVVDAQSFTLAAKWLDMPTTTVSAKVARLEQRLGVTLIRRTTRRLHITDAGQRYYTHCVRALEEIAEAEREMLAATVEPTGTLRICSPPDFAQHLLTPLIEQFLARYPKVSAELIVTNREVDLIGEGIDLAVRVGPLEDSTLIGRKFRTGRVGLWAAPDYLQRVGTPDTVAALANHELLWFKLRPRLWHLHLDRQDVDISFNGRLATDNWTALRTFLIRGNGIGLLTEYMGEMEAAQGRLVRVLPALHSDTAIIYLVYPAQSFVPPALKAFMALANQDR